MSIPAIDAILPNNRVNAVVRGRALWIQVVAFTFNRYRAALAQVSPKVVRPASLPSTQCEPRGTRARRLEARRTRRRTGSVTTCAAVHPQMQTGFLNVQQQLSGEGEQFPRGSADALPVAPGGRDGYVASSLPVPGPATDGLPRTPSSRQLRTERLRGQCERHRGRGVSQGMGSRRQLVAGGGRAERCGSGWNG